MITLNLTISVPSQLEVDDFCAYHGWTATVQDPKDPEKTINNPVTKAVFAKNKVAEFIKNSIKSKRANSAAETARTAEITSVDALSIS